MSKKNEYMSFEEAIENKSDDQIVVSMGVNQGFKLVSKENW